MGGGDAARYGQVPERGITRTPEQACDLLAVVDIQVPDGISAAVKGAAVQSLLAAYGRPQPVLQVDIRRQHRPRGGVLRLAVLAVDDVAERLQLLRVGDEIGIVLRAAARNGLAPPGCQGQVAGDECGEVIRRAVLKPPQEVGAVRFRIIGLDRRLARLYDLDGIGAAQLPVVIGHGAAAIGDGAGVPGVEGAARKDAQINGKVL